MLKVDTELNIWANGSSYLDSQPKLENWGITPLFTDEDTEL